MFISVCFFFGLTLVTNPGRWSFPAELNSYKDSHFTTSSHSNSLSYSYSLYLFLLEAISRVVWPFPVPSCSSAFLLLVLLVFFFFGFDLKSGGERERENGLMDLLGIKPTTPPKNGRDRRDRDIASVGDAAAVPFARESIVLDGNQRRKNPLLVTSFHPSISLNSIFPSLSLFILPLFCCCFWRVSE